MTIPSEATHEDTHPYRDPRGLDAVFAGMPWERPAPPPPPGPCTWCGAPAPQVLPEAPRYDGPAVYACPVEDGKACDDRKRARDTETAEAAERAVRVARIVAEGSAKPATGTPGKPRKAPARRRPSQRGETILGQAAATRNAPSAGTDPPGGAAA